MIAVAFEILTRAVAALVVVCKPVLRRRVVAGVVALTTLAGGTGSACGGGCRDTRMAVRDLVVTDPAAPASFVATLRSGGNPVLSARVTFYYLGNRNGRDAGARLADVRTDANGTARWDMPRGLADLAGLGLTLTGFQAEFDPIDKVVGGVEYCSSSAEAAIRPPVQGRPA